MTVDRVALIDRDESHVDVPDLDLVLPTVPPVSTTTRTPSPRKRRPHAEAAVCWGDEYAVRRLAEVRAV
jgi:hypothetical protein